MRKKLKPELVGRTQEEVKQLRLSGQEVTDTYQVSSGNTSSQGDDIHRVEATPGQLQLSHFVDKPPYSLLAAPSSRVCSYQDLHLTSISLEMRVLQLALLLQPAQQQYGGRPVRESNTHIPFSRWGVVPVGGACTVR